MRCIALISGGLDSHLAALLVQRQGVAVEALHCRSIFAGGQDRSVAVAAALGVRLTVVTLGEDYLELVRQPRFGYGRGANPCVDCRVYMFTCARELMERLDADFVISGEVVGQRAGSQKRRDLDAVAHHSGLRDRLLRPLSAKMLVATLPEREGWIDRQQLYGFYGRGRRGLLQLARSLGIDELPTPSTGCVLTEPPFARKVFDLVGRRAPSRMWDFELLKYGRHFRVSDQCKVIIGRREAEDKQLEQLQSQPEALNAAVLAPEGFVGPTALIVGAITDDALACACRLVQRFAKHPDCLAGRLRLTIAGAVRYLPPLPVDADTVAARNIADA
jgi:tRNA-uridine 2-sulfurtransferase